MMLTLMAEGQFIDVVSINEDDGNRLPLYVKEYNRYVDNKMSIDTKYDPPSFVDWMNTYKHIPCVPMGVSAISIVDGYWYP